MAAGAQPGLEPRVFRIFISYASEDLTIAAAIGTCLKVALGDFFCRGQSRQVVSAARPGLQEAN
jgi:hypothetical protein